MSKTYIATTAEQLGARQSFLKDAKIGVDINTIITPGDYIVAGNDGTPSAAENQAVNLPDEAGYFALLVNATLHYNGINGCSQIAINRDTGTVYSRANRNDAWTDWIELADAANFLPLDGSVAMTNHLSLRYSGFPQIMLGEPGNLSKMQHSSNGKFFEILNESFTSGSSGIRLFNGEYDINNVLKYMRAGKAYNLFGEHNTSLLAKAVEKEIQNGGLSTLDNAIQIFSGKVSKSQSFEVTGKGIMFITPSANMYAKPSVTADNVSLGTTNIISGQTIEIGFLNNCVVTAGSSDDAIYCNAVCY